MTFEMGIISWVEYQKHRQENRNRHNQLIEKQPMEWDKIFANHISDTKLMSRI